MNRATFYLHFANKSELFEAIIGDTMEDAARYWRLLDDALMCDSQSAIRAWIETAFQRWDQHAPIMLAWQEASASDPRIAATWKHNYDQLSMELKRYLGDTPDDQREDARIRVQLLVVQLDQVCFRWRVQHVFDMDREQFLDLSADMWCAVLRIRNR